MDIESLTIGDVRQLSKLFGANPSKNIYRYSEGKNYLIRTVTMIYVGKLVEQYDDVLVLTSCSWIAETSRWMDTIKTGSFDEVEPYYDDDLVCISRGAMLDAVIWRNELPKEQK